MRGADYARPRLTQPLLYTFLQQCVCAVRGRERGRMERDLAVYNAWLRSRDVSSTVCRDERV